MALSDEQIRAFMVDLRALTMKHGIAIFGCGCCDSPSLGELPQADMVEESGYVSDRGGFIRWLAPGDFRYTQHRREIVGVQHDHD